MNEFSEIAFMETPLIDASGFMELLYGSQKADEEITGKGKSVLRSRLQVEWNIKKSNFAPYASCELYHSMSDSWTLDKTRWTVGAGYKINKKNSLDFFYRYQNHSDDDETNGHVVGAGYKFKFEKDYLLLS